VHLTRPRLLVLLGAPLLAAALSAPAAHAQPTASSGPVHAADGAHAGHTHMVGDCVVPDADVATSARGGRATDHRSITVAEQTAIEQRTRTILARKYAGGSRPGAVAAASAGTAIPVYVHVMQAANGSGDVTATQIDRQIQVLNSTYAGAESSAAAATGFTFTLAGVDRFRNDTWHADGASTTYRSQTRQGGKNALNIWLVDFDYLGVATFPWDYAKNPGIDGIRVQYTTLPGGSEANYDLGKTTTHETGHWLGLYHTFQGGCTTTNDKVNDTPAQSSASTGCPEGRDSCTSLAGLDPIHNYMDYSFDSCYDQFTPGQSTRMAQNFSAYRA